MMILKLIFYSKYGKYAKIGKMGLAPIQLKIADLTLNNNNSLSPI
jgi:hypothetical protein